MAAIYVSLKTEGDPEVLIEGNVPHLYFCTIHLKPNYCIRLWRRLKNMWFENFRMLTGTIKTIITQRQKLFTFNPGYANFIVFYGK